MNVLCIWFVLQREAGTRCPSLCMLVLSTSLIVLQSAEWLPSSAHKWGKWCFHLFSSRLSFLPVFHDDSRMCWERNHSPQTLNENVTEHTLFCSSLGWFHKDEMKCEHFSQLTGCILSTENTLNAHYQAAWVKVLLQITQLTNYEKFREWEIIDMTSDDGTIMWGAVRKDMVLLNGSSVCVLNSSMEKLHKKRFWTFF